MTLAVKAISVTIVDKLLLWTWDSCLGSMGKSLYGLTDTNNNCWECYSHIEIRYGDGRGFQRPVFLPHTLLLYRFLFLCFSTFAVGWCEMKGSYACVTFRFNLVLDWSSVSRKGHQTHCKTIFSGYDMMTYWKMCSKSEWTGWLIYVYSSFAWDDALSLSVQNNTCCVHKRHFELASICIIKRKLSDRAALLPQPLAANSRGVILIVWLNVDY